MEHGVFILRVRKKKERVLKYPINLIRFVENQAHNSGGRKFWNRIYV